MKCITTKLSRLLMTMGVFMGLGITAAAGPLEDWPVGETLYFEGLHGFYAEAVAEHQILFEGDLVDKVAITRVDKRTLSAVVEEYFPTGEFLRTLIFEGTISEGGVVTLTNESALSDMMLHIGIIPHGPGVSHGYVTWKGFYDGVSLVAQMHGIGVQIQPATFPLYNKDPSDPSVLFTGPIEMILTMDLVRVE